MPRNTSWNAIFDAYNIHDHNFNDSPFELSAQQIKDACRHLPTVSEKEVRIICKQDSRNDRPEVFQERDLFLLPTNNGLYKIIKGEGYVNIPNITDDPITYNSQLDFHLDTSEIGNSEMQHLDFAYASSLIRTFMDDPSLVLTIRGRKYTPEFSFNVGQQNIIAKSVQTEVDAGYEGRDKIVLIEAKNSKTHNTIIRQLFYPYKQWKAKTKKKVFLLFFEKRKKEFFIWQYTFTDENNYNSIVLARSARYRISGPNETQ